MEEKLKAKEGKVLMPSPAPSLTKEGEVISLASGKKTTGFH